MDNIIQVKKECFNEPYCEISNICKQLCAKEQECEELKKKIDEAKNSKLDLKSFLVGEAVQNEYEQQLDQLKAENEELKKKVYKYEQAEKYPAAFLWQEGLL